MLRSSERGNKKKYAILAELERDMSAEARQKAKDDSAFLDVRGFLFKLTNVSYSG